MDLFAEQIKLETRMYDEGAAIWARNQARNIEQGAASNTSWNRRLTKGLILPLAAGLDIYVEELKGKRGVRSKGAYILEAIDRKAAAFIAIKVLFDMLGDSRATMLVRDVAKRMGSRIEDNIRFTKLEDAAPGYIGRVKDGLKRAFSHKYQHASAVMAAAERSLIANANYAFDQKEWIHWSDSDRIQVGLLILDIMEKVSTIEGSPLIEVQAGASSQGEGRSIMLSKETVAWCDQYKEEVGALFPAFAPCVVPPKDWESPWCGGFHTLEVASRLPLVKSGGKSHIARLTKAQMPAVYQAVNYLQRTAWRVNTDLLAALDSVMESGKSGSALPDRVAAETPESPIPAEFSDLRGKALEACLSPEDLARFRQWRSEVREMHEAENTRRAKLLKSNSVRQQAREYAQYDALYFVWNVDSRGRVYCNSSRLSPQGDDLSKALIVLADQPRLGRHGRKWLAVHGMGVWAGPIPNSAKKGDKVSIADRIEAVRLMESEFLDYAAAPEVFTGWMNADKPWCFLAWCIEWAKLREFEQAGGDAADFRSGIPVAMDGSCSGIQHYSAMLRDPMGGKYVNLTGEPEQQDIYGEVARRVIEELGKISRCETRAKPESLADADQVSMANAWLSFGIDRNFCKKPVMTLPYGSTQLTARENVEGILDEMMMKAKARAAREGLPFIAPHPFARELPEWRSKCLTFIVSIVWEKIGEVVPAAREAMKFIRKLASQCAKENRPMDWTTPTGFIVRQAIFQREEERIDTALLGRTTIVLSRNKWEMDQPAMTSAAAPNFVHSYDASHLVMVCCAAEDAGIPGLACIHDSFGAPAGRSEELAVMLRETFVDLYDERNPLASLQHQLEEEQMVMIEEEAPKFGNLDLEGIMRSDFAFI